MSGVRLYMRGCFMRTEMARSIETRQEYGGQLVRSVLTGWSGAWGRVGQERGWGRAGQEPGDGLVKSLGTGRSGARDWIG